MSHTVANFSDITKADNWGAHFWVQMQHKFDDIKNKNLDEAIQYCRDTIMDYESVLPKAMRMMKENEKTGRMVADAIYAKIERAIKAYSLIKTETDCNEDEKILPKGIIEKIASIRAMDKNSTNYKEAVNYTIDSIIYVNGEIGSIYQMATLLSFAKETSFEEAHEKNFEVLQKTLDQYNSIANSLGKSPLFLSQECDENLNIKQKGI